MEDYLSPLRVIVTRLHGLESEINSKCDGVGETEVELVVLDCSPLGVVIRSITDVCHE